MTYWPAWLLGVALALVALPHWLAVRPMQIVPGRFTQAGIWCLGGVGFSLLGLIHSYKFTPGDTVVSLQPAWWYALGYAAMAIIFLGARYITEPNASDQGGH